MIRTKQHRFHGKIDHQRRQAERTRPFREARNDAPACPWLYSGFEEPPRLEKHFRGGTTQASDLERSLTAINQSRAAQFRSRRG